VWWDGVVGVECTIHVFGLAAEDVSFFFFLFSFPFFVCLNLGSELGVCVLMTQLAVLGEGEIHELELELQTLPPLHRARLQVAMRQCTSGTLYYSTMLAISYHITR
jgi:hypothetical protein